MILSILLGDWYYTISCQERERACVHQGERGSTACLGTSKIWPISRQNGWMQSMVVQELTMILVV